MEVHCLQQIGLENVLTEIFGTLGLVGLYLAYQQLSLSRQADVSSARTARATFLLEINRLVRESEEDRIFFYRLDYDDKYKFVFDEHLFRHSDDEIRLDRWLYLITFVGNLVRREAVDADDVKWMRFIVRTVLGNYEVQRYLMWLQSPTQVPNHAEFVDAIFLYEQIVGRSQEYFPNLCLYLKNAKTTGCENG